MNATITNLVLVENRFKVFITLSNGTTEENIFMPEATAEDIKAWVTERVNYYKELELKDSFNTTVRDLNLAFVNTQAAKDAFAVLNKEGIEDEAGMKKAVEQLQKDRPYLFGEASEPEGTDARERGHKQNKQVSEKERQAQVAARFNIRKPR